MIDGVEKSDHHTTVTSGIESNAASNLFEVVPPEVLTFIFGKVAAYHFIYQNSISHVCQVWRGILQDNQFVSQRKFSSVLAACQQDSGGVPLIFNDKEALKKLSIKHIFELAGYHEMFAKRLLDEVDIIEKVDPKYLIKLGKKHTAVARHILSTPLLNKLHPWDISELGSYHTEIAELILDTPKLKDVLPVDQLVILSRASLQVAMRILKDPILYNELSETDLIDMGAAYIDASFLIIEIETKRLSLTGALLSLLASDHLEVAQHIMATPELYEKLSGEHLLTVGFRHHVIGQHILNNEKLLSQLNDEQLHLLTTHHEKLKAKTLKEPNTLTEVETAPSLLFNQANIKPLKLLDTALIDIIASIASSLLHAENRIVTQPSMVKLR